MANLDRLQGGARHCSRTWLWNLKGHLLAVVVWGERPLPLKFTTGLSILHHPSLPRRKIWVVRALSFLLAVDRVCTKIRWKFESMGAKLFDSGQGNAFVYEHDMLGLYYGRTAHKRVRRNQEARPDSACQCTVNWLRSKGGRLIWYGPFPSRPSACKTISCHEIPLSSYRLVSSKLQYSVLE